MLDTVDLFNDLSSDEKAMFFRLRELSGSSPIR